jgi:AcrR family transcriptional regulator
MPAADVERRIEDTAIRLFIERGYNAVSYIDIGREIGLVHSSIHYYFRTKDLLAEAVLRRVAEATLSTLGEIWRGDDASLFDRLVQTRDWIHGQYLQFNPDGRSGRPWGLIGRFTVDAESLSAQARRLIRTVMEQIDRHLEAGVRIAIMRRELVSDAPVEGLTLQLSALISVTHQLTRRSSGFDRLDELMRWTYAGIVRAYGRPPRRVRPWPPRPSADPAPIVHSRELS